MEATQTNRTLVWLWIFLAGVILLTLLLVNQGYAGDNAFYDDLSSREKSVARKMEKKYLDSAEKNVLRFKGDAEIKENERIVGNVMMLKGTLTIHGQVDGDVLAVFGDVQVRSTAVVNGDVISVNGKVWTHDDADISGDVVVTSVPLSDEEDRDTVIISKRRNDTHQQSSAGPWLEDDDEVVFADYNRVDGATLGMQFPKPGWWANHDHHFALIGKGGYSFASKFWQYQIGLERWSGSDFRFTLGGEIHDITDTQDRWIICEHENAIAAFFIKEDFRDYYRRNGFSLWAAQNLSNRVKVTATYQNDDIYNTETHTNWALFGKNKSFRNNPLALPAQYVAAYGFEEPLTIKSLSGTLTIDTRNDHKMPTRGWYINAFAERAGKDMDNFLEFERYILDIEHYFPLNWDEHLSLRLRGATSSGILPPVYWYDLGGISTLRGFNYKEFSGDRMLLGNAEYHLRAGDGNFLGLDLIFFVDSGLAWFANPDIAEIANTWPVEENVQEEANSVRPEDGFDNIEWSSLKTNVGVALASPDGDFRVNFAKRIDKGGQDYIVTFRLCQPF